MTPRCPLCGSTFTIDPDAETEHVIHRANRGGMPYLEHVRVKSPTAFCNGCENCISLTALDVHAGEQ